jgi:hypothetical protein
MEEKEMALKGVYQPTGENPDTRNARLDEEQQTRTGVFDNTWGGRLVTNYNPPLQTPIYDGRPDD